MDINVEILAIINQLEELDSSCHLNERYIHHLFSHRIQNEYPMSFSSDNKLHPEWATCIKDKRSGGRYKHSTDGYWPVDQEGSPGFIDFAIGDSEAPDYAIEFKMAKKLDTEGVTFDYMKLMDSRNHFKTAISLVVYYGHKTHSTLCEPEALENCLETAQKRLKNNYSNRPHGFHVVEIIDSKIVHHLVCTDNHFFENK